MKIYILLFALAACQVAPSKSDIKQDSIIKTLQVQIDSKPGSDLSDHKQDSVIQILQAEIALQNDIIYGLEKEVRTIEYYASENNEQLIDSLQKQFYLINSALHKKRESDLGRFIGTVWAYKNELLK